MQVDGIPFEDKLLELEQKLFDYRSLETDSTEIVEEHYHSPQYDNQVRGQQTLNDRDDYFFQQRRSNVLRVLNSGQGSSGVMDKRDRELSRRSGLESMCCKCPKCCTPDSIGQFIHCYRSINWSNFIQSLPAKQTFAQTEWFDLHHGVIRLVKIIRKIMLKLKINFFIVCVCLFL